MFPWCVGRGEMMCCDVMWYDMRSRQCGWLCGEVR